MAEERSTSPPEPDVTTELRVLVQRAQAGEAGALPRIRQILDDHPEIWQHVGDLTATVERAWIAVLAADQPLAVESIKRTIGEMRVDLAGGEHPTRLERLLADQVIACWLQLKHAEASSADTGRASLEQAAYRLRRLESAQKRFQSAVQTLTTVRTLMPAALGSAQAKLHESENRQRA